MANIALNKPSGGQLILSPEDGTSTETVTIPSVGVGKVLQVVQDVFTGTVTTTSQSWVDTPLSITITPTSADSRILIMGKIDLAWDKDAAKVFMSLDRNGSDIFIGDSSGSKDRVTTALYFDGAGTNSALASSLVYMDSPATTSAVTYKIKYRRADPQGTVAINRGIDAWSDSSIFATSASSLIVMEVAA